MKAVSVLIIVLFILVCWAGCNNQQKAVLVTVEGVSEFPPQLAGHWVADKAHWQFVIEPDGNIDRAMISLGTITVLPGQTIELVSGEDEESEGIVEPGIWKVSYDGSTDELKIELNIKHIRLAKPNEVIEGSSSDIFAGPVDMEAGIWEAQWYSFPEYFVTTEKYKNFKFEVPPEQHFQGVLRFTKKQEP